MDIIFMNSGNSKIPDSHRLLLNLWDTITLNEVINILHYHNLLNCTISNKELT